MKVKFTSFPTEVENVLSNNNSAKLNLRRLERGTSDTERTWFYEDIENPDDLIEPVVSKLKGMTDWPEIASWDLSKLDKFQAQGKAAPFAERVTLFEEYFDHLETPPLFKDKRWQKAKLAARQILGFNRSGSPITIAEVVERGVSDGKYNTSSGYPQFLKRKNPDAIAQAVEDATDNRALRLRFPFMVGSRAQMGKVGVNARFIFMAPMAVNICGQRYAQPLQDYLTARAEQRLRTTERKKGKPFTTPELNTAYAAFFTPWLGWDKVQSVISDTWDQAAIRFGADYTKMDQHFNKYHALEVYDVIKWFFRNEFWDELKEVMLYPFTAPIITSEGYVDQEHALLSGSEWTNLVETMFNFILVVYCTLWNEKTRVDSEGMLVVPMGIGDDQLWFWGKSKAFNTSPDAFRDAVLEVFESAGLPGNPDKQEGIQDVDESGFLQRHMWSDYNGPDGNIPAAGVYPLIRNVTSQVFPERYHNDKEYDWRAFATRVIMIAENCCTHPLFNWYVTEFVANANPNILRFVMLTDAEIDNTWQKVKNIAGFRPNYNQEKQDKPLREFETFKLLREVAKTRKDLKHWIDSNPRRR